MSSQKKLGKVITIANQKGGVGKTTLTTLIANILHFKGGIDVGYKVAILDLDDPQFSTYNRRKKMEGIFKANKRKAAMLEYIQKKYPVLDIYPATLDEAPSIIQDYKNKYDFIFLDMPGTLNTSSNNLGFVYVYVNHFFIPIYQCGDTISSSVDFYSQINEVIAIKSIELLSCHFFFNRVPPKNELAKYTRLLNNSILDAPLLKNFLYQYRVYENSFRNTMVPIVLNNKGTEKQARNLLLLVSEMLSIINDQSHHQYLGMANHEEEESTPIIEIPISSVDSTIENTESQVDNTPLSVLSSSALITRDKHPDSDEQKIKNQS